MSTMHRRKGARAEVEVVALARAHGYTAARTRSGSGQARGDIAGLPGVALEVKRCERESYGWPSIPRQRSAKVSA